MGLLLWGVFACLLVLHVVSVFTETINWDEWALLFRSSESVRTGVLQGGGRPGLATLALVPFAKACTDAVEVIRSARLLWTGVTVGYVFGFWLLIRRTLQPSRQADAGAALAVGLLVLVPAFLRSSLQIRADQAALLLAVWGGVALLESQKRVAWAAVAGALVAVGFLFSQKAFYVAGLVGALAAGRHLLLGEFSWRREAVRVVLCLFGGISILWGFRFVASQFTPVSTLAGQVEGGMGAFEFYRLTLGYRQYAAMLPTLAPHLLTLGLILIAAGRPRLVRSRSHLQLAMLVFCLGLLVLRFHAARFEYFWLTLGLFPAAAAGVGLAPMLELLKSERARLGLLGALWLMLVSVSVPFSASLLRDSQRVQSESLEFIERSFPSDARGFSSESALFCRNDPEPFPTYFSQHMYWQFQGPDSVANAQAMLREFRERPVAFVVETYRLDQLPQAVRDLLTNAYVPYRAAVMIPGYTFTRSQDAYRELETIVPGTYRWMPRAADPGNVVEVDGRTLRSGDTITLDRGRHDARWSGVDQGFLVLAVTDPPQVSPRGFYGVRASFLFFGMPHPAVSSGP